MSPDTAVIGSLLVVALCVGVAVFATKTYRQSAELFSQAMRQPLSEAMELVCGARMGLLNATSPFGRVRIADDGIDLAALGKSVQVPWSQISAIDLVKPFNGIGWGVRIRSAGWADHIVWLLNRALADRVLQASELRGVRIERQLRPVF